jgi:hypothetical protein
MKWLERLRARKLAAEQQRRLREFARLDAEKTQEFLQFLGDKIRTDNLPARCPYVYEMILEWSQDDPIKIKQAALYLFLWEVEEKRAAISWEVNDIALEIEQMVPLRKSDG